MLCPDKMQIVGYILPINMGKTKLILDRKEYTQSSLEESLMAANPMQQFDQWLKQAQADDVIEANAMTLSTVSQDNKPSARMLLLKEYDDLGFIFFTNYQSQKAKEIAKNNHVALTFYWRKLERQVRVEGKIEKTSAQVSNKYFALRPRGAQIGAWSSPQSQLVKSRQELEKLFKKFEEKFNGKDMPRPNNWGGYRVKPNIIEFWQGRLNRFHDRIVYTKNKSGWKITRLAP